MRLVFMSSVTAMTPLRTISVTTGSWRGFFSRLLLDFLALAIACTSRVRRIRIRIKRSEPRRHFHHEPFHRTRALFARRPILARDQEQHSEAADIVIEALYMP